MMKSLFSEHPTAIWWALVGFLLILLGYFLMKMLKDYHISRLEKEINRACPIFLHTNIERVHLKAPMPLRQNYSRLFGRDWVTQTKARCLDCQQLRAEELLPADADHGWYIEKVTTVRRFSWLRQWTQWGQFSKPNNPEEFLGSKAAMIFQKKVHPVSQVQSPFTRKPF